jgi:dihydrofolate reductase
VQIINLIAAVARNGVIGKRGGLPWYLPEDLKMFRKRTVGSPVVMGRRTFDALLAMRGKPLDGRSNIVITRQRDYRAPESVLVAQSLDEALGIAEAQSSAHGDVFIAGGGEIYALALPLATRLYLTEVDANPDGEVFFPAWEFFVPRCVHPEWEEIAATKWLVDEASGLRYRFLTLERKVPITNTFEEAGGNAHFNFLRK